MNVLLYVIIILKHLSSIATLFKAPESNTVALPHVDIDAKKVAEHLAQAIQFQTVSAELKSNTPNDQFEGFIRWLENTYPDVHQHMSPERLGGYSMLYKWQGTKTDLPAILLSAHYDVVPVLPGTQEGWSHPPYKGVIDETHVWGRGALDDKSGVIAIMEAASLLLAQNYQPTRTVYLSITHDEEIGGRIGTNAIVNHLKEKNVQLDWSIDEGSFLLEGFFPGVEKAIANINVAEKGMMTVNLIAKGKGGHSSIPPKETSVGVLAKAITKLESAPMPGRLEGLSGEMFDEISRYMPFEQRLFFANRWLFGSMIDDKLANISFTNALLRTTTAPTMLSASSKQNVLAIEAIATVNFRIHPRDSIDDVLAHVTSVIDDDRVTVKLLGGRKASRVSSTQSKGFNAIANTVKNTYGDVIIALDLTVAGTDSHHYEKIAKDSYRFNPMVLTRNDLTRFHGSDERISIKNMVDATNFYSQLIKAGSRQ